MHISAKALAQLNKIAAGEMMEGEVLRLQAAPG
jgi:hypothetical protein